MTKVIQIKDVENYAINLEQMCENDNNIEVLNDAKDFTKCRFSLNMEFTAHSNYYHEQEKTIELNSEFIQIKLVDYMIKLLKDWNERLQKNNEELEVEVDLDGK